MMSEQRGRNREEASHLHINDGKPSVKKKVAKVSRQGEAAERDGQQPGCQIEVLPGFAGGEVGASKLEADHVFVATDKRSCLHFFYRRSERGPDDLSAFGAACPSSDMPVWQPTHNFVIAWRNVFQTKRSAGIRSGVVRMVGNKQVSAHPIKACSARQFHETRTVKSSHQWLVRIGKSQGKKCRACGTQVVRDILSGNHQDLVAPAHETHWCGNIPLQDADTVVDLFDANRWVMPRPTTVRVNVPQENDGVLNAPTFRIDRWGIGVRDLKANTQRSRSQRCSANVKNRDIRQRSFPCYPPAEHDSLFRYFGLCRRVQTGRIDVWLGIGTGDQCQAHTADHS